MEKPPNDDSMRVSKRVILLIHGRSGFESRGVTKSMPVLVGKGQAPCLRATGAAKAITAEVVGRRSRTGADRLRIEIDCRDRPG
jgi:hypothetical protein